MNQLASQSDWDQAGNTQLGTVSLLKLERVLARVASVRLARYVLGQSLLELKEGDLTSPRLNTFTMSFFFEKLECSR